MIADTPPVREDASGATHFVRFYQEEEALLAEVAEFLDRGLRGGGPAIVIATHDHLCALRRRLAGLGSLDGRRGWFPGELVMLEAAQALAQFMIDDWPDEQRFDDAIGTARMNSWQCWPTSCATRWHRSAPPPSC